MCSLSLSDKQADAVYALLDEALRRTPRMARFSRNEILIGLRESGHADISDLNNDQLDILVDDWLGALSMPDND